MGTPSFCPQRLLVGLGCVPWPAFPVPAKPATIPATPTSTQRMAPTASAGCVPAACWTGGRLVGVPPGVVPPIPVAARLVFLVTGVVASPDAGVVAGAPVGA